MRAIDTNIVVRLIVEDDAAQRTIADRLIEEPFLVLPTVVLETVWVVQSQIGLARADIVDRLRHFLGHQNALVQSGDVVGWALDRFEHGADFGDMLHVGFAIAAEADKFATFDKKLQKHVDAPGFIVETLP
jgi:predicted nucleic-acid-binding protein